MRILLVTSQVTYVPNNYLDALAGALRGAPTEIAGLALMKNFDRSLVKTAVGLYALGCRDFSSALLKNMVSLIRDPRKSVFARAGVPVLSFGSMNDPEAITWVTENKIDLIVNMRTRCIYKATILKAPRLGCVNVHHGLLPDFRGTMCDLYALTEGQPAGFSVHVMNEKIDAGQILHREIVSPKGSGEKNYVSYLQKSAQREGEVLSSLIQQIKELGRLPVGEANQTKKAIYSRNPSRLKIREIREKGMVL
jgi:methionyl-tRNA formyltransferase